MGSSTIEGLAVAREKIEEAMLEERGAHDPDRIIELAERARAELDRVVDVQWRIAGRAGAGGATLKPSHAAALRAVVEHAAEHGVNATVRDVAAATGSGTQTAHRALHALERRGLVSRFLVTRQTVVWAGPGGPLFKRAE